MAQEPTKLQDDLDSSSSKSGIKKSGTNFFQKNLILIIPLVLLLILSGVLGYLYYRELTKTENTQEVASEENRRIKEAVARHMLLPEGDPAVATIIDVDKLKEQSAEFYANAENGDKLLVYTNKAILYDPDQDIILNVAPIVKPAEGTTSNTVKTTVTPSVSPTPGK